jgi:hypothetical protein
MGGAQSRGATVALKGPPTDAEFGEATGDSAYAKFLEWISPMIHASSGHLHKQTDRDPKNYRKFRECEERFLKYIRGQHLVPVVKKGEADDVSMPPELGLDTAALVEKIHAVATVQAMREQTPRGNPALDLALADTKFSIVNDIRKIVDERTGFDKARTKAILHDLADRFGLPVLESRLIVRGDGPSDAYVGLYQPPEQRIGSPDDFPEPAGKRVRKGVLFDDLFDPKKRTQIGFGSYGIVYVFTEDDGKKIAVKKALRKYGEDMVKDTQEEFDLMNAISHPNILRVLDFFKIGDSDSACGYTSEYFPGNNFTVFYGPGRPTLTEQQFWFIASQLTSAVRFIYEECIAHRDIACRNVLFDRNYRVKLIDFGLACIVDRTPDSLPGADVDLEVIIRQTGIYAPELIDVQGQGRFQENQRWFLYEIDVWDTAMVLLAVVAKMDPAQFLEEVDKIRRTGQYGIYTGRYRDSREFFFNALQKDPAKRHTMQELDDFAQMAYKNALSRS